MPRLLADNIRKYYAHVWLSEEQVYESRGFIDDRFVRKYTSQTIPPTKEVWARYYAAKNALRVLGEYEFTEWGGPDYGTEVPEPSPTHEITYLETHEEWLDRCRALYKGDIA